MDPTNSQYELRLIAHILHDVHNAHGLWFNTRALKLTLDKVNKRTHSEGIGFLTKTLPRLGKAFDKAIAGGTPLNAEAIGFSSCDNCKLPRFLGEFISRVLQPNGEILQNPCAVSVAVIRQITYLFYKYELPYSDEQEQQVASKFEKTETDLETTCEALKELESRTRNYHHARRGSFKAASQVEVVRNAQKLLWELFRHFDPLDITPRHGPGAVATKQQRSSKFLWTNISDKITSVYPLDEYYYASLGHVCDSYKSFDSIGVSELPARVVLVPKDSRGPRLISCEPVDYQWIQQGLGRAIVKLVESHPITKWNVNFTDQVPNRIGALWGSESGKYSTLDLNEASDRVSLDLVRLMFPSHVYTFLEACRTSSTTLPCGRILKLKKFAPMGSSLCFPILALVTWAILTAAASDQDTKDRILVYGDDVIVPTAFAANAIEQLESFGLKVNRDKSCTGGLFRESCGMDAFQGINVTPVRLRTVWSSEPSPDVYLSWLAYANFFYDKRYFKTYDYIVGELGRLYGPIPDESMALPCPSLREAPLGAKPVRKRWNKALQKVEFHCLEHKSSKVVETISGWSMLLRFFSESCPSTSWFPLEIHQGELRASKTPSVLSVSEYTNRRSSKLVRRWR